MKKHFGALLATLFAGMFSLAANANDSEGGVALGVWGTWTEPSENNNSFITVSTLIGGVNNVRTLFIGSKSEFGGGFEVTYRFPCSNYWIVANVDLFDTTSRTHYDVQGSSNVLDIAGNFNDFYTSPINVALGDRFEGTLSFGDDVYTLGLRHLADHCSERFDMVWGAYLQWVSLDRVQTITFADASNSNNNFNLTRTEKTNAWGPYFDMTGRAYLWASAPCFSFYANVGTGLLYADTKYTISGPLRSEAADGTKVLIVKYNTELGFEFNKRINNSDWRFKMRAGPTYVNYINAFKNGNISRSAFDAGRFGFVFGFTLGGYDA